MKKFHKLIASTVGVKLGFVLYFLFKSSV